MRRNKPTTGYGTALAIVSVFALIYPISLLLRANSVDANLFATFVLIAAVSLLMVIDAISIVLADGVTDRR